MNGLPTQTKTISPYQILKNEDESVEIEMYGEVVESIPIDWWTGERAEGLFICMEDFLQDLKGIRNNQKVTIRINSPGGDLDAGIVIYNRLKDIENLTTVVDGLAASAASLIAQAGKKRCVYQNSEMMVHSASVMLFGFYNRSDLKDIDKRLVSADEQVIQTYMERTGRDHQSVKHMVTSTTWMTGQEIVDEGFADEVIQERLQMAMNDRYIISNSLQMDRRLFRIAPPIENSQETVDEPGEASPEPTKEKENPMTLDELRAQEPDLVRQIEDNARASVEPVDTAAIEAQAVAAERERIRAIEAIEATIADRNLIQDAKYGEHPMDARDLAYEALQRQASMGNIMMQNILSDAAESGTKFVKVTPEADDDAKKLQDQADLKAAVKALFGKEA
jgi:ATP-dependent protease ClpP protease subunit